MSGRFVRASSFRHVHGDAAKIDKCFTELRPQCNGEGNYITANSKFFAFAAQGGGGPVVVQRLDKPGRLPVNQPKLQVHKADVLDFDFNPFIDTLLATGGEDCHIKVSQIPEEGMTENISTSVASMEGHEKKVTLLKFHPTANNILGSASADNTLRFWDISQQAEVLQYADFGETIFSFDYNENGSQIVTTSKDLQIRVFDPREAKSVLKTDGFPGSKSSKAVWMGNKDKIAVVGFGKASERMYGIWDPKKMDKPLVKVEMDKQAGVMIPFYDPDTSCLYIGSKGGSNIAYYEITDSDPYVHGLSEFRDNQSQKGLCFLPKRACDASQCEIAVCLRLMKDSVVPVSFKVPRKSDMFQKDLFPDTYAGVSALEAAEWLAGENKEPVKASMNPKDKPQQQQQTQAVAFKASKSPAQLQAELDAAHKRIAELEAELAKLKA